GEEGAGPVGRGGGRVVPAGRAREAPQRNLPADAAEPAVRAYRRLLFVDPRRQDAGHARPLVSEQLVVADVESRITRRYLLIGDEQRRRRAVPGTAPGAANVVHRHADASWERSGHGGRATGGEQHQRGDTGDDDTHGRLYRACGAGGTNSAGFSGR